MISSRTDTKPINDEQQKCMERFNGRTELRDVLISYSINFADTMLLDTEVSIDLFLSLFKCLILYHFQNGWLI